MEYFGRIDNFNSENSVEFMCVFSGLNTITNEVVIFNYIIATVEDYWEYEYYFTYNGFEDSADSEYVLGAFI